MIRNPFDLLIGAVLFLTPEIAPYFWPVVAFCLALVIIILVRA